MFEPFTDQLRALIIEDVINILNSDARINTNEVIVDEFEHGLVIQCQVTYIPFQVEDIFTLEFDRRTVEKFNNQIES